MGGALRFGSGIKPEDLKARDSGNNVVFALMDGSGGITFAGANTADEGYHLDRIRFADKTE